MGAHIPKWRLELGHCPQAEEGIYLGSAGPQTFHISFNFQDLLERGKHPDSFSSLG